MERGVGDVERVADAALTECDLLLMPTTPLKAQPMPGPGAPRGTSSPASHRDTVGVDTPGRCLVFFS